MQIINEFTKTKLFEEELETLKNVEDDKFKTQMKNMMKSLGPNSLHTITLRKLYVTLCNPGKYAIGTKVG